MCQEKMVSLTKVVSIEIEWDGFLKSLSPTFFFKICIIAFTSSDYYKCEMGQGTKAPSMDPTYRRLSAYVSAFFLSCV